MANKTKAKKPKAAKAVKKKATPKKVIAPKIVKPKADKPKAEKPVKAKAPKGESKLDKMITLLSRPQGATVQDLMDATEWQQHTVRSALSHALGKKRSYKIVSSKDEGKARVYKIESPVKDKGDDQKKPDATKLAS